MQSEIGREGCVPSVLRKSIKNPCSVNPIVTGYTWVTLLSLRQKRRSGDQEFQLASVACLTEGKRIPKSSRELSTPEILTAMTASWPSVTSTREKNPTAVNDSSLRTYIRCRQGPLSCDSPVAWW